jgi:hypothetical protein
MQTSDIKKPMSLHTDYGVFLHSHLANSNEFSQVLDVFELDMTISHNVDGSPVAPELVDNCRKLIGAGTDSSWKPSQLFAIHGLLLASASVVVMPLGVAVIQIGHPNAFKIHWVIQLSAVAFAVSGTAWGIYLTWGHPITVRAYTHWCGRTLTGLVDCNFEWCSQNTRPHFAGFGCSYADAWLFASCAISQTWARNWRHCMALPIRCIDFGERLGKRSIVSRYYLYYLLVTSFG